MLPEFFVTAKKLMDYSLMYKNLIIESADPTWHATLSSALAAMDSDYLTCLSRRLDWLPGPQNMFNAFKLAKPHISTVLLGESPYPRAQSANGYAFWDAAVGPIWSENGLSKPTNRATSLRNFIKMLLVANHALEPNNVSQAAIAALPKDNFVQTLSELFSNMLSKGFLLLNASLVLSNMAVSKEAKYWFPFVQHILTTLCAENSNIQLLLFGKIAQRLEPILPQLRCDQLICEHPYNVTFIHNKAVIKFFRPLNLLQKISY